MLQSKLVHNATKFTIKGSITISTRMLEEQKEVVCEVTDTGVGIPRYLLLLSFSQHSRRRISSLSHTVYIDALFSLTLTWTSD